MYLTKPTRPKPAGRALIMKSFTTLRKCVFTDRQCGMKEVWKLFSRVGIISRLASLPSDWVLGLILHVQTFLPTNYQAFPSGATLSRTTSSEYPTPLSSLHSCWKKYRKSSHYHQTVKDHLQSSIQQWLLA